MKKWVILGAGNFLSDILDAIQDRGDTVKALVYNQQTQRRRIDSI